MLNNPLPIRARVDGSGAWDLEVLVSPVVIVWDLLESSETGLALSSGFTNETVAWATDEKARILTPMTMAKMLKFVLLIPVFIF